MVETKCKHKTSDYTDRIDRTIGNAPVCRTFLRSIFFMTTTHGDGFTTASDK
jgi:hypothetical protein